MMQAIRARPSNHRTVDRQAFEKMSHVIDWPIEKEKELIGSTRLAGFAGPGQFVCKQLT